MELPAWLKRPLVARRFRAERSVMKRGLPAVADDAGPSVIYFTVHKCASTFVPRFLNYVNRRYLGLRRLNMAGYLWHHEGDRVYEVMQDRSAGIFGPRGFMYAPLRQAIRLSDPGKYRIVLMLRDPRDLLVSHYFSVRYSHKLPAQEQKRIEFLERRSAAGAESLDDYVRRMAPVFKARYADYVDIVARGYGVAPLRYEDMVSDTTTWVGEFFSRLELSPDEQDIEAAARLGGFGLHVRGRVTDHIRRREPGEYREKLAPDTARWLDDLFGPELGYLGYGDSEPQIASPPQWGGIEIA